MAMNSTEEGVSPSEDRYTPSHIANYFIWLSRRQNIRDLTPMKLIKLVYIGYAWYYYLEGKPLFEETIEAWEHGPVIPALYAEFKEFGKNPIAKYATQTYEDDDGELGDVTYPMIAENDKVVAPMMEAIFDFYKEKTGAQLSDITHGDDGAWKCARDKRPGLDPAARVEMDTGDSEILDKIKEGAHKGIKRFLRAEAGQEEN